MGKLGHMAWGATFMLVLALLPVCKTQRQKAPDDPKPSQPVGVEAIRKRGKLRLLTRNNGFSYFVLRGERMGFDYEMGLRLAKRLGVKLEIIVPPNWGDLIPMLERGEGDIVAAGINITPERQKRVVFAKPYALSHMRVVWGPGQTAIASSEDLSGKSVHVRLHSSYYRQLDKLSRIFEAASKPPIDIVIEGESLETEEILAEVNAGRVPYTLCDEYICRQNALFLPRISLGPNVSDPQPLAWAVHPEAKDLIEAINLFFAEEKTKDFQAIYERYYDSPQRARALRAQVASASRGTLSAYDDVLRLAGGKYGVDWKLLAAVAHQETQFDPKAKTWNGGRGLFGMLPSTARKLGAKSLKDPHQAALAAAEQLALMRYEFAQLPNHEDQWKLALAAYHAGPEYILDARLIAAEESLDPDEWSSIAKILPLMSKEKYARRARSGYLLGRESVAWVDAVWSKYRAYRHATGERDRTTP